VLLLHVFTIVGAEDWPQAGRDGTRNPVSEEKNPPTWWQWEERDEKGKIVKKARNIKWAARLGTHTKGDPIVANGLIWVGSNNGHPRDPRNKQRAPVLQCFREKDGEFLYQHVTEIGAKDPLVDFNYTGHTSSPVAQGDRLWFTTVTGQVLCLDIGPLQKGVGDPREIWKLDMRKDLGVFPSHAPMGWGRTCSISAPYKNRIYVLTGNGVDEEDRVVAPKAPSLLCLDKDTGKVLWSDNSPGKNIRDGQYASPLVVEIEGRAQVIAPTGDGWVRSFDALSGKILWQFDVNPKSVPRGIDAERRNNVFATAVYYKGLVYVATGNSLVDTWRRGPGWLFCLDPKRKGDISLDFVAADGKIVPNPNSGVQWRFGGLGEKKRRNFHGTIASVAIHDDLVILGDSNGYVNCLDARTGEHYWKHDVEDEIAAAPLVADGKIFVASMSVVTIFHHGKEKKLLRGIDTDHTLCCSPIFANGVLYLACSDALYAIAGKDAPPLPPKGEDWPQFGRDQTRNAVSPEKNPPIHWQLEERDDKGKIETPARNIQWSVNLGSVTYGDPVVVDGMLWVSTNNRRVAIPADKVLDASVLQCLDVNKRGKTLYRYVSPRLPARVHDWPDSSMGCSPLIEKDRLWFTTNRAEVVCLDFGPFRRGLGEPRVIWKLEMIRDLGVFPHGTPMAMTRRCSVAGFGEFIYVITGNGVDADHVSVPAPLAPSLICLNKNTGKLAWSNNSPGKNILHGQWASPLVIEIKGQAQVIAPLGDGWVRSFDALSGKLLWEFDTNPKDSQYKFGRGTRNNLLATPVYADGHVFIGNGHHPEHEAGPAWLYCIDPMKRGDISPELSDGPGKGKPNPNSGMVWRFGGMDEKPTRRRFRFHRTVSNVVVHEGLVIAADILGEVHCLDARTGKEYWSVDTGGAIHGSPLIVGGNIYVGNDADEVWILRLSKEKDVLATIEMEKRIRCSPIFAHGILYIVAGHRLYAIAGRDSKAKSEEPEARDQSRKTTSRPPDAIFVPTPQDVVEKMLELAAVKKSDRVYDLGCGDGRIVVTAAKKYGCHAVGVDLDPVCVKLARGYVQNEKLERLVTIEQKDLFTVDLTQADVIALYLLPRLNVKLLPQLAKLKPGARIVSHEFPIAGIRPDRIVRYRSREDGVEHALYLWTAPLKKE